MGCSCNCGIGVISMNGTILSFLMSEPILSILVGIAVVILSFMMGLVLETINIKWIRKKLRNRK
jgi:hypothetical protein